MSNKSRLQTNNTNLQVLIDKANALPDAGSGGNIETCSIIISNGVNDEIPIPVYGTYYNDGNISSYVLNAKPLEPTTCVVIKHSFLVIPGRASALDIDSFNWINVDSSTISGISIILIEDYNNLRIEIL